MVQGDGAHNPPAATAGDELTMHPKDPLTLIKTAFTGQGEIVEQAFRENESFCSLCEDYAECVTALDRWKQQNTAEAAARRREYADLLVDLDREIQAWLEAWEGRVPGSDAPNRSR
jgi:uncharacterized protein YdiU (UPF0061 family)